MTRYELSSDFYATRYRAGCVRDKIEAMAPDRAVTLSFAGVQAITGTFADELVCGLTAAGWQVTVEGANEDVADTIQLAMRRWSGASA